MQGKTSQLDGGQELTIVSQRDFNNGNLLSRIIDSINGLAKNLGAVAVGKLDPPPPIQSINVQGAQSGNTLTCPSEILHWTINHTQEIQKHVNYFSEIATEPNFLAPHVIAHGASRTGFLTLPTYLNDGATKQTYFLRSYAQYPGSDPHTPVVLGGLASPLRIQMTGSSATTLLSSTGSGTAAANGSQGGKGLGVVLTRPAPTTKRSIT